MIDTNDIRFGTARKKKMFKFKLITNVKIDKTFERRNLKLKNLFKYY